MHVESKLEQAVEATYRVPFPVLRKDLRKALRPFFPSVESVEVDLDLRTMALRRELWAEVMEWDGDGIKMGKIVARHFKALAAELQPAEGVLLKELRRQVEDYAVELRLADDKLARFAGVSSDLQPKPKVWPEGKPYPKEWANVKEWRPRFNGDYVQIRWGDRGYESAGVWDEGSYYLMGANGGGGSRVDATHATHATHWRALWRVLKAGPE